MSEAAPGAPSEPPKAVAPAAEYTITPVYRLRGQVVRGFGRGSTLLGFPTANLDPAAFEHVLKGVERGVYFGWASVCFSEPLTGEDKTGTTSAAKGAAADTSHDGVFKAMVSLGTSPQFQTQSDTVEAYIVHEFPDTFYGKEMTLILCGFIRPMVAFKSLDELIAAIHNDVRIGSDALAGNPALAKLAQDPFFTSSQTSQVPTPASSAQ